VAAAGAASDAGARFAAAAVADALATAFMLLTPGEVEALCGRSPGLEAWLLEDAADGRAAEAGLLHFGGSGPRYTSASS
jgi:hypothetical protein